MHFHFISFWLLTDKIYNGLISISASSILSISLDSPFKHNWQWQYSQALEHAIQVFCTHTYYHNFFVQFQNIVLNIDAGSCKILFFNSQPHCSESFPRHDNTLDIQCVTKRLGNLSGGCTMHDFKQKTLSSWVIGLRTQLNKFEYLYRKVRNYSWWCRR